MYATHALPPHVPCSAEAGVKAAAAAGEGPVEGLQPPPRDVAAGQEEQPNAHMGATEEIAGSPA